MYVVWLEDRHSGASHGYQVDMLIALRLQRAGVIAKCTSCRSTYHQVHGKTWEAMMDEADLVLGKGWNR